MDISKGGGWQYGANPLLNQFGKSGVAMFFMITAFLFTRKAMSRSDINWRYLYVSRLKRLFPLYFMLVTFVFMSVFVADDFTLHKSVSDSVFDYLQWISFVVFGRPDINAMKDSALIIAGVNWSLKYEVLFYIFAIPAIHLLSRKLPDFLLVFGCLLLGAMLTAGRVYLKFEFHSCIFHFLCGMVISIMYKNDVVRGIFESKKYHFVGLICAFILAFTSSPSISLILLFFIFSAVIGGASVFGVLKLRPSIWLGDVSYGIYLLHGVCLYSLLLLFKQFEVLDSLSMQVYWVSIVFISIFCTLLASASYVFLERPIMNIGRY